MADGDNTSTNYPAIREWLRQNPKDPRAADVRNKLQSEGQLPGVLTGAEPETPDQPPLERAEGLTAKLPLPIFGALPAIGSLPPSARAAFNLAESAPYRWMR